MIAARAAGVPEPEVHHVLSEGDGLGPGFRHGVARRRDARRPHRSLRGPRRGAAPPRRGVRRGAGAHPRHRRRGHRPRSAILDCHDARTSSSVQMWDRYRAMRHPAAHDRLHGAVAARPPAGRLRDGARAQRLPQRQLHGGRDGHRRRARLGGRPHRRPHAGPRLDLHELVALRRRRPGGRIRELRGPVPRLRTRIGETRGSGPRAVLGGLRLLLVGRRLPPDGGALPHGTRPERGAPRHRAAHVGVPGRLRQPADPRPRADPGAAVLRLDPRHAPHRRTARKRARLPQGRRHGGDRGTHAVPGARGVQLARHRPARNGARTGPPRRRTRRLAHGAEGRRRGPGDTALAPGAWPAGRFDRPRNAGARRPSAADGGRADRHRSAAVLRARRLRCVPASRRLPMRLGEVRFALVHHGACPASTTG